MAQQMSLSRLEYYVSLASIMTSHEEANKEVVRRLVEELVNAGNYEIAEELIAADYVRHGSDVSEEERGPDPFVESLQMMEKAFPDGEVTIEEMIAEDDLVAFCARWRATHEGEFMGIKPSGETTEHTGMAMHRVKNGQITETWANWDWLSTMQQLGAMSLEPKDHSATA